MECGAIPGRFILPADVRALRNLHYGLCLLCALACYRQRRYSALIAMAESSVNLLILLAGVMLAIVRLGAAAGDPAAGAVLDGNNLVNFLLSGALLPAVFYSAQENLRTARGNH
jgi:hypothetical protein